MSIKIGKYHFEGPFMSTNRIQKHAGIFIVLAYRNGRYDPIECGEADNVKVALSKHSSMESWSQDHSETLRFAVYYTPNFPAPGRAAIAEEIRTRCHLTPHTIAPENS